MADHFEPAGTRSHRPWSVFVPLFLLALAYLAWTVFQTTQMLAERTALGTARANQEKTLEEAKKLRERLDALSKDTQLLANRGNKGASLVIEELRRRGITFITEAPAPSTPAVPPAPETPATAAPAK